MQTRLELWWKSKSSSAPPEGVTMLYVEEKAASPLMKYGEGK